MLRKNNMKEARMKKKFIEWNTSELIFFAARFSQIVFEVALLFSTTQILFNSRNQFLITQEKKIFFQWSNKHTKETKKTN